MNVKDFPLRLLALVLLPFATACQAPAGSSSRFLKTESVVGSPRASIQPAFAPKASKADPAFHAEEGGVIRVAGHLWDIQGDYDGNTVVVVDNSETVLVADYDPTVAPEIGLGYRGQRYGWDLTFKHFESEGEFAGGSDDDQWNYLDLDFKQFYFLENRLQPFISMGVGYFFGTVTDGVTDGVTVADSDFSGISLNLGGGLALYLTKRLAIDIKGIYRLAKTVEVESIAFSDVGVDGGLNANGYGVSIGINYTVN